MNLKKLLIGSVILGFIALSGCSKDNLPGTYDASEVGKVKKVIPGIILSKRPVVIRSKTSDAVTLDADANANETVLPGVEYVIKLDSGSTISVVQNEDLHLKTKQHILVIYGENTRIVADQGN